MYQIYLTENLINNKYYIGIHKGDVYSDYYYGSGVALKSAISKYGRKNFKVSIISKFDNKELGLYLEKILIGKDVIKDKQCYNIVGGGRRPKYKTMSEQSILKMLKNRTYYKGEKAPFYGKSHSLISKKKISKSKKGFKHTEVTKNKIKNSTIKNKVLQLSKNGKVLNQFESVVNASNVLGVDSSNIYRCCNKKRKTAYGFKWKYERNL